MTVIKDNYKLKCPADVHLADKPREDNMTAIFVGINDKKGLIATDTRFYDMDQEKYNDNYDLPKIFNPKPNIFFASSGSYRISYNLFERLKQLDQKRLKDLTVASYNFLKDKKGQDRLTVYFLAKYQDKYNITVLHGTKNTNGQRENIPYYTPVEQLIDNKSNNFQNPTYLANPTYDNFRSQFRSSKAYQDNNLIKMSKKAIELMGDHYWYCNKNLEYQIL